jgi:hypothetical protein
MLSFHLLLWGTVMGQIFSGIFFLYEHFVEHSVAYNWLLIPAWLSLYLTAFLLYWRSEKKHDEAIRELHDAFDQQKSDTIDLRHLIKTRDIQLDQLLVQTQQLNREAEDKIGRPAISLSFKDVNYQHADGEEPVPWEERTEFIATCSGQDAFFVFLHRLEIGNLWIHSVAPVEKFSCGESKRLEYSVHYSDDSINLSFRGRLRDLMEQVLTDSDQELLNIPICISYADAHGTAYQTAMIMSYVPGVAGTPMIEPVSTTRLRGTATHS